MKTIPSTVYAFACSDYTKLALEKAIAGKPLTKDEAETLMKGFLATKAFVNEAKGFDQEEAI